MKTICFPLFSNSLIVKVNYAWLLQARVLRSVINKYITFLMSKLLIKVICSPASLKGNIVKYGVKSSLVRSTASTQIIFYEIIYLPFNDNEGSHECLGIQFLEIMLAFIRYCMLRDHSCSKKM